MARQVIRKLIPRLWTSTGLSPSVAYGSAVTQDATPRWEYFTRWHSILLFGGDHARSMVACTTWCCVVQLHNLLCRDYMHTMGWVEWVLCTCSSWSTIYKSTKLAPRHCWALALAGTWSIMHARRLCMRAAWRMLQQEGRHRFVVADHLVAQLLASTFLRALCSAQGAHEHKCDTSK